MEELFELLKTLYLIRFYSKDIHYNAKGSDFWGDHLLADKVFDGLDGFIDAINETLYLGYELTAPYSKDVLRAVYDDLPPISTDISLMWNNLYRLLGYCLDVIEKIRAEYETPALSSLLDGISQDIQAKRGLIWRRKLSI